MRFLFLGIIALLSIQPTFAQINPVSDPENADGWILNKWASDEFNGTELNKTKWWILGENNDYRTKWKGRAPGQFAPHNVIVKDGHLILRSQWEPTFDFAPEKNDDVYYGGSSTAADLSKPITQACIMSETFFQYGYMEIKCKIADAPVTSAFWTTGYHSEIDMVENYGKRPIGNPENTPENLEYKYRTNLISWDPDRAADHEEWKVEEVMKERLASDFFIYGFEWDKNFMKIYFNGHLIKSVTKEELEAKDQWKYDYPQEIWLDSEVFSWYGLPNQADLEQPAEFIIDYVRIWQKEETHSFFDALSFEGPFHFQGRSVNWWSSAASKWRMKDDKALSGKFSLRYENQAPYSGNYSVFSPYGSINLPAGDNELTFHLFIDENTTVDNIEFVFNNPWLVKVVDISALEKGKWVEVKVPFNRSFDSNPSLINGDRLQIRIQSSDIKSDNALLFIDDISFLNDNQGDFPEYPFPDDEYPEQEYPDNDHPTDLGSNSKVDWKVYPNPTSDIYSVESLINGSLKLFDLSGALLHTVQKEKGIIKIDVKDLPKGIYVLAFETLNEVVTKKVVKE
ncbi:T9SS type A sorting domain-containing protein [Flammeovirga yaeyamensis]|uniref:T9SS type A sorting domain-containing protein n=1 Tax=Flammeovirga yaeyamensis TaxID=367791 RepID=A0AAX1NAY0_9BACT|nr:T9SS type A sorting domain-containing protein [Flammeovirga yaeyamensis]MBB3699936.1 hypothetical protein [Flammeovirga yaeyamensis]NMF37625.1 T9SS type A sorting domain-containing protein [Flammeovirga yaeyamensis]QWG04681.1 T9SS type A sorting domain-containing protein [Flammeovirga yaeyamensis]